jgi:hypothetical protein
VGETEERERNIEQVEYEENETSQSTSRDIRKDRDVRCLRMSYVTTLRTRGGHCSTQLNIENGRHARASYRIKLSHGARQKYW